MTDFDSENELRRARLTWRDLTQDLEGVLARLRQAESLVSSSQQHLSDILAATRIDLYANLNHSTASLNEDAMSAVADVLNDISNLRSGIHDFLNANKSKFEL